MRKSGPKQALILMTISRKAMEISTAFTFK